MTGKKLLATILFLAIVFLFYPSDKIQSLPDKVNTAFYQWDEKTMLELLAQLEEIKNKNFDELFLLTKLYFRLAYIDLEKNQGNRTKKFINDDEYNEEKGLMNLCVYYGERAFKINKNNTELNYYLTKGVQSHIHDVDSFFKYKDKKDKYRKQNLKIDPDSFFTLLYETDFHSAYGEAAGADRKKGKKLQEKIEKLYPDNPETLNLISSIAFDVYDYKRAEEYCRLTLQINPDHFEAERRLDFLLFLNNKPVINEIIIQDKGGLDEKTIRKFIHVKEGGILNADIIKKIRDDFKEFHSISDVDIYYDRMDGNKVNIRLVLSAETDKVIYLSGGYEFVYNSDRMDQYTHHIKGITPIIFFYSYPNLFKKGVFELNLLSVIGMEWDVQLLCNFYEKVQFNFGIDTWVAPIINQFKDYSAAKKYKAEMIYVNINPYMEIGKKLNDNKIEFFLRYKPNFIFMMPEDFSLNDIENDKEFIYPKNFFVEHNIGISFCMDYITLLESGLVRKGFKIKGQVDWYKKTPDFAWGYKDHKNEPTFASFLFYLYLEYSHYLNDLFYFSLGLHYKGGINLYHDHLISVGKGVIGVPFGGMMKIHGLNYNNFMAEHVFLFNSLYGFKASSFFHLGLYFDMCSFFEREADGYLAKIPGSDYYNNLIFGYGCFFKWSPYKLLVLTMEVSFSHEVGKNIIRGPVVGFHIQKTFVNPKLKKNKGGLK